MNWQTFIQSESEKDYFKNLMTFLSHERSMHLVHPNEDEVFRAFELTPLSDVRVVILGQDPYPTPGHAHGLAFSADESVRPLPKSLLNIYKEIHSDLGLSMPQDANLVRWSQQGVLLLNTILTVRSGHAKSHEGKGWEQFTDAAISLLNEQDQPIVFLLWGKPAQTKISQLNNPHHLVLCAPHPSPLSAYRGFFGCGHFGQTNDWLQKRGLNPIDW